jgi:solute carrier family 35 protein C2
MVFGSGHIAFPCPLLLTSIHFLAQWMFSAGACRCFPHFFGGDRVSNMSWREWVSVSVPCGLVTSADIGLSNLSLISISITFYTMVKASTPIFVLLWAYVFGIERITINLVLVVLIIAAGELLTVIGEVDFDLTGFLLSVVVVHEWGAMDIGTAQVTTDGAAIENNSYNYETTGADHV